MNSSLANTTARGLILAGLLSASSVLTAAENAPVLPRRWAPNMLGVQSASQIDAALNHVFDTSFNAFVHSDSGRRKVNIDSCLAWQTWRGKIAGTEPESDFVALRGHGVECDALALLRAAKPARRSALPANLVTITDSRLYPATLWGAASEDDGARLARPGLTLAAVSGVRHWQSQRNGLLLEDETAGTRLVWIARADFDGDGWEDGLYQWQAWMRGGTWTDIRLVILTRRAPRAALVEVALPLGRAAPWIART